MEKRNRWLERRAHKAEFTPYSAISKHVAKKKQSEEKMFQIMMKHLSENLCANKHRMRKANGKQAFKGKGV